MFSDLEERREAESFGVLESAHFSRWCSASEVVDFEGLCDLMVLEQLKNSLPLRVATYVSEQKEANAAGGMS